jgi:hydrogenase-4 component E
MSAGLLWAVLIAALAVVAVRRRSLAIVLTGAQSLILGGVALSHASGRSTDLLVAGIVLIVKGVALPVLLGATVRRTRERRALTSEPSSPLRLAGAVAPALAAVLLMPGFGLSSAAAQDAAVALVMLGLTTAAVRRSAIFQALGFLIAENGLYVAALSAPGGVPPLIELGLVFDLVVIISVAAALGVVIHREFGTADTSVLRVLRG